MYFHEESAQKLFTGLKLTSLASFLTPVVMFQFFMNLPCLITSALREIIPRLAAI